MSTSWKSQVAKGDYRIQFETDDYEKYKIVEKACCAVIDTTDKVAAIKKIEAYIKEAREIYFKAEEEGRDDYTEYAHGRLRGLLDAFYVVGGMKDEKHPSD